MGSTKVLLPVLLVALLVGCDGSDSIAFPVLPTPTASDALTFAGSAVCRTCHQAIYESWEKTRHTKKVREANLNTIVNDADSNGMNDFVEGGAGATFDVGSSVPPEQTGFDKHPLGPGIEYPKLGYDGANLLIRIGPVTYVVTYVLGGTGKWKQRYMSTIDNQEYILPVQFNDITRDYVWYHVEHWYTYNDANGNGSPDSGETLTGYLYNNPGQTPITEGKTRNSWQRRCIYCHTTGARDVSKNANNEYGDDIADMLAASTLSELPIACEACHGPSMRHVELGGGVGTALNPADLASDRGDEVCGSCHLRGSSKHPENLGYPWAEDSLVDGAYRPGDVLWDFFNITGSGSFWGDGFRTSKRHHQQWLDHVKTPHSQAGITCWACHDPHGSGIEGDLKMEVTDLCLSCHDGEGNIDSANLSKHTGHADLEVNRCNNCHFTLVSKSAINYDISDHTYRVIYPLETDDSGIPNACAKCHREESTADLTSYLAARFPNVKPVAYAHAEPNPFGTGFDLDGTQSFDPLGGPITYEWSFLSGPPSFSTDQLLAASAAEALFVPAAAGIHRFQLVVTNLDGLRSWASVVEVDVPAAIVQATPDLTMSRYMGAGTCQICHSDIHRTWEVTRHKQKVRRPNEGPGVVWADTNNNQLNDWIEGGFPPTFSVDNPARVGPPPAPNTGSGDAMTGLNADAGNTKWDNEWFDLGTGPVDAKRAPLIGSRIENGERVYYVTIGSVDLAGNLIGLGRTFEVTFVLGGTGKWKQRYMATLGNNTPGNVGGEYILPIQYNEVTNEWVTYHPEDWYDWADLPEPPDFPGGDGAFDSGEPLNGYLYNLPADVPAGIGKAGRSWQKRCTACHATGARDMFEQPSGEFGDNIEQMLVNQSGPRLSDLGVACEACHGPGSQHVPPTFGGDGSPSIRGAIVNPSKLSALRSNETCGACHNRGKSVNSSGFGFPWGPGDDDHYIPGLDLDDFYKPEAEDNRRYWNDPFGHSKSHHQQWLDYRYSKHFTEAGITCADCHTNHDEFFNGQLKLEVNTLCTSCHQDIVTDGTAAENHSRHAALSDANQCTACHLPLTQKSAINYDIRAHSFEIIWPVSSAIDGIPNSCMTGDCHTDPEGGLMAWSPTSQPAIDEATDAITWLWGDLRPYAAARVFSTSPTDVTMDPTARRAKFTAPVTVTLDGSRSFDANGEPIIAYTWTILSAPATNAAMLSSRQVVRPTIDIVEPGTYVFSLVVADPTKSSRPETVTVEVEAP